VHSRATGGLQVVEQTFLERGTHQQGDSRRSIAPQLQGGTTCSGQRASAVHDLKPRLGKLATHKRGSGLGPRPWLRRRKPATQRAPAPPGPSGRSVLRSRTFRLASVFVRANGQPRSRPGQSDPSTPGGGSGRPGRARRAGRRRAVTDHPGEHGGRPPLARTSASALRGATDLTQTGRRWSADPTSDQGPSAGR